MNTIIQNLIHKMRYHDRWYKNDFAQILSVFNPDKGNDLFFRDCIYAAVEGGTCKSLETYFGIGFIPGKPVTPRNQYDFPFKPEVLIKFAYSKSCSLPKEFDEIEIAHHHNQTDLNIIAAMLHVMFDQSTGGIPFSTFENQTRLVEYINNQYKNKLSGTSKRSLESIFSIANDILVKNKIK